MPKGKVKPVAPVELMAREPEMVSVRTMAVRVEPVRVTAIPGGMVTVESPSGAKPSVHVSGLSKAPDFLAVYMKVTRLGPGTEEKN